MSDAPEIKPIAEGLFSKTPFAHILIYLYEKKLSGTLMVRGEEEIDVYFREGTPAKVKSTISGKGLGRILCDLNLISEDQLRESQEEMKRAGGLQGQILISRGAIDVRSLVRGLREQILLKLVDIFNLGDASYAFYKKMNFIMSYGSSELFPLDPYPLLVAGLRAHGESLSIQILDTLKGRWLAMDKIDLLKRFRFDANERKVCTGLLRAPVPYETLFKSGGNQPAVIRRVLYSLMLTKQLKISETSPELDPIKDIKSVRFDSIVPDRDDKEVDPKVAALREHIKEKASEIASQDYYEMLGLPFSASIEDVRKAFFRMAKQFHPDRAGAEMSDLKETLEYIFSNLSEAHTTLIDLDTRQEYEAAISDGRKRTSIVPPPNEKDEVREVLEAESLYQKALIMIRREQLEKALDYIDRARMLNPSEGEYRAAWSYLQSRFRPKGAPIEDLIEQMRRALETSPKSERINFYLATLLKRIGHLQQSKGYYEKVVELNPRNIEAARELRLMEMRSRRSSPPEQPKKGFFRRILG